MSDIWQTHGRHMADTYQTHGRHMADIRQTHGSHMANTRPPHGWHIGNRWPTVLQICSHDVFTHASTEALTYMLFLVTGSGAAILYLNLMQMTLWTLWYVVSIFQTYSLSINNCHDAFKDLVETTLLWVLLRLLQYWCIIFCRTNLFKVASYGIKIRSKLLLVKLEFY